MELTERFTSALEYAAQLHRTQVRKGGDVPYMSHLLAVAGLVMEHGAHEDEVIAALLHDAIEDQGGAPTREAIRARFGDRVVAIVDGCTDTEVTPKPPWRARKDAYLDHLRTAEPPVRLVSAADKLHNARMLLADFRSSGDELWRRFNASQAEILWFYREVVSMNPRRPSRPPGGLPWSKSSGGRCLTWKQL